MLTVWEPFIDVMTRTGSGHGLAPGTVDFEEIDRAYEQSARHLDSFLQRIASEARLAGETEASFAASAANRVLRMLPEHLREFLRSECASAEG